jgi:hypothetical protein
MKNRDEVHEAALYFRFPSFMTRTSSCVVTDSVEELTTSSKTKSREQEAEKQAITGDSTVHFAKKTPCLGRGLLNGSRQLVNPHTLASSSHASYHQCQRG